MGSQHIHHAVVVATLMATAACAPTRTEPPPITGAPVVARDAGVGAQLRPIGSAIAGRIRVVNKGDGVGILFSANNILPGPYRLAFHENGNCSSPNGFSAGPLWAPPGRNPTNLIPPMFVFADGSNAIELHVSGVRVAGDNGVSGRSILVYEGNSIEPLKPDVRNNVIACGVLEPVTPFF